MTRKTGTSQIVISAVVLAIAGAVVGLVMVAASSSSSSMAGMAGMDHGSGDASTSAPVAADAGGMPGMDMPGMDSGTGDATAGGPPPTPSGDMPGMDMPGMDMSGSTPTPTPSMAADMPGMDMPGMDHEHGSTAESAQPRPLVPVLGTFGGGTSAVLVAAGFLRRKDRAASLAKKATRLARKAEK